MLRFCTSVVVFQKLDKPELLRMDSGIAELSGGSTSLHVTSSDSILVLLYFRSLISRSCSVWTVGSPSCREGARVSMLRVVILY